MQAIQTSFVLAINLILHASIGGAVVERTATARKGVHDETQTNTLEIRMPTSHPSVDDSYVCTYLEIPNNEEKQYVVGFKPRADPNVVHHMILFSCDEPAVSDDSKKWDCHRSCKEKGVIMYAWPKNAADLVIPKGVGFAVGGDTGFKNLVLQIHYDKTIPATQPGDASGLDVTITNAKQPFIAGIYLLLSVYDNIPPKTYNYDIPVTCKFEGKDVIHPFAFRPHAHKLGTMISGYKKNSSGVYLIGSESPQKPQAFYPIKKKMSVKPGDYLAAVCSYDSEQKAVATSIGPRHSDEMCNFYIMYYTENTPGARSYYQCSSNNYPDLVQDIPAADAPADDAPAADAPNAEQPGNYPPVGRNDRQGYDSLNDPYQTYNSDYRYPPRKDYQSDYYNNYDLSNQRSRNRGRYKTDYDLLRPEPQQYDSDYDNVLSNVDRSFFQKNGGLRQDSYPNVPSTNVPSDPLSSLASRAKSNTRGGGHAKSKLSSGKRLDGGRGSGSGAKVTETKLADKAINLETTGLPPPVKVEYVHGWPVHGDSWKLGQVAGVTTAPNGDVLIFHRGSRVWDGTTFNAQNNKLSPLYQHPIKEKTIFRLNDVGKVVETWGQEMFYLPHGMHMDKKGNLWLTDVGMHQVFRFGPGEKKPSLTLGKLLKPGSDYEHFCKPTDVAVLASGDFFVADGYCNSRIMKFDKDGTLLLKLGEESLGPGVVPTRFQIPHSITLSDDENHLYVADRENGRVVVFNPHTGEVIKVIDPGSTGTRLFAISYSPMSGGMLFAVNGQDFSNDKRPVTGFTISLKTDEIIQKWAPNTGMSSPHDVTVDGNSVYVCEIGPNKVWKFKVKAVKDDVSTRSLLPQKTKKMSAAAARISPGENLGKSVHSNDALTDGADMSASMIIGALLIVPIIIIIIVTVIIRLRKSGKLRFNKHYKNNNNKKFNLGDFFGRHQGFDRLNTEESDPELDHLSDSEVEEYSATTQKPQYFQP